VLSKDSQLQKLENHALFKKLELEIDALNLAEKTPVAVATSGGADSLSLTLLLNCYCKKYNHPLYVLHVNHHLRSTSTEEACFVQKTLAQWGLSVIVLDWQHPEIKSGLQEKARHARYQLMSDYCKRHGISYLFIAHHLEDQIETVMMRFFRGSDLNGLQGMKKKTSLNGIQLIRPFLALSKKELHVSLSNVQQDSLSDPSNEDTSFSRIQWRKALGPLLNDQHKHFFLQSLEKLQENFIALTYYTEQALKKNVSLSSYGTATFNKSFLQSSTPHIIKKSVLDHLLKIVSGSASPIRTKKLKYALKHLSSPSPHPITIAGCMILPYKRSVHIIRERAAIHAHGPVENFTQTPWDGRFLIHKINTSKPESLVVTSLSCEDIMYLKEKLVDRDFISNKVLLTLPVIKKGREIFSVPHLGYNDHLIQLTFTGMTEVKD
jgi:tRNA(Ile)-lysidine synthase